MWNVYSSVQFSRSVVSDSLQSHGMQCSRLHCPSPTPGACSKKKKNNVHQVGDAIQSSHPLSSPSLPAFSISQHQSLFFRLEFIFARIFKIFIGVSLLYNVVLFFAVKQSESVIHIPALFWIYFLFQWGTEEEAMWTNKCVQSPALLVWNTFLLLSCYIWFIFLHFRQRFYSSPEESIYNVSGTPRYVVDPNKVSYYHYDCKLNPDLVTLLN